MKKINRKTSILLFAAIFSGICLFGGIPLIVIGATNEKVALLVLGIAMVAIDFYACPIFLIAYTNVLILKRTAKAVNEEHIYDVKNIAMQTGKPEEFIKQQIRVCLEKGYIVGFLFDGEKLTLNRNVKADKQFLSYKCLNCGATVNYYSTEHPVCPYCGTPKND